jgi:amino acid adenylation domain-containing protein
VNEPLEKPDAQADRIAGLSPVKRALLEMKLKQRLAAAKAEARSLAIPRRVNRDSAPLSFAQQRLWFLDQLEPGSPLYTMPRQIRAQGALDVSALEAALSGLIARHESLRTRFMEVDGQPIQLISPPAPIQVPVVDIQHIPEPLREQDVQRLAAEEARRAFDLTKGSLFRVKLLRLGAEDHVLLLTLHHIISDGWSMGVLFKELGILYEASLTGTTAELPELPIQYADYAAWQRDWLQGPVLQAELAYWRQQFKTELAPLQLPSARTSLAPPTHEGAHFSFTLSAELTEQLKQLSRQEGATLFMTLLAAFKALLFRYTGQEDVVVASPVAGRNRLEVEGLIGFFVNLLALRTDVSGDLSFRELLARVADVTLGALTHQDLPFERLVEELQPERSLGRNPLVQVMFALQNTPRAERRLSGLVLHQLRSDKGLAKFDLALGFREEGGTLVGVLRYNTELFDRAIVARLAEHYQTLVTAAAADPGQRLSALPILAEGERRQLLVDWNSTARDWGVPRAVHSLFEQQAARAPEAPAVLWGNAELSYRELNARANQVAQALQDQGVGPGAYVPLLMLGGPEVVIGMLGALKAGAAFVPLDPDWPVERLRAALSELSSPLVLVGPRLPFSEAMLQLPVLVVDPDAIGVPGPNPELPIDLESPIYAIYTSGSTGIPKAAVVPHRGITNRFLWMNDFFGAETSRTVLQTTRHVYDSAVWQLLWPLINGGKTVIPDPGSQANAEYLAELIERQQVTITDFVPSVFNALVPQLLDSPALRDKLKSLRAIIVGGEEITPATTYQFISAFPGVRVINLYGPTEASIGCICHEVTGEEGGEIPIGRPIKNVRVLVLDGYQNPVPVGVAGELYLGGSCVGLGYLNDAEKTRASFVDNPLPEMANGKLYRTGDRVRYRPDGNLEFLGRLDRQVKLRGLRIELGEIETALGRHPAVHECLVILREDTPGDKRLVGYFVPAGPVPSVSELRAFLSRTLPEYMLPATFMALPELPRGPSGKVYRRALPRPDYSGLGDDAFVEPRTDIETVIAGIWGQVLRLERIGVHTNFFELGGHSLLATQLVARIRTAFGIDLPLRALFEAPTVAGLAERIEAVHAVLEELAPASQGQSFGKASVSEAGVTEPKASR